MAEVSAVWLCDRGFHRVAWLAKLLELRQGFVVRLQRDVTVHLPDRACLLLVGVELLMWTVVGQAVEDEEPGVRLESKEKGGRLSLVRVGAYYWQQMSRRVRLTAQFVREHLPPPRLRMFKWLVASQK